MMFNKNSNTVLQNNPDILPRIFHVIAHEIRAPLAIISANTDMMSWPEIDEQKKRELIESIKKQTEKLNDYISEISVIAKGKWRPKVLLQALGMVDIDRLVLSPFMESVKNHKIEIDCKNNHSGCIMIDAEKMKRVLENLLLNSMEAGGKDTSIELRINKSAENIMIEFRDHGPGLPRGQEETIFEPFITYNKSNNIGLGLTICRGIIRGHGGEITGSNPPDGGALFTIKLPICRE
jgi:K+-sensing histidine kinase KdpD